jgi:NADH-quinone oxidoreductase subunit N
VGLAQSIDYAAIAPPVALAGTALTVLVADLFLPWSRRGLALPVSLAGVGAALVATLALVGGTDRGTFCTPAGSLPATAGGAPVGPSCSFVVDDFTRLFWVLFLLVAAGVLLLSRPTVESSRLPVGEYHFLLLASFTGMLTIAASRDLLMLVLSLELVSVPGFLLAGLRRGDPRSTEAALKFFVISVLATAVMLFGMSLVYGVTGSLQLDRIAAALSRPELRQPVAAAAVTMVIAGFGFKVSAVPFHFWAPDTYVGSPVPVAAYLSVASKAAGFAGLLLVLLVGFRPYADVWGPLLAVLAAVTMTLGNLVALRQRHVVRLLAWSSIAQAGYMLVPLGVAATAPGRRSLDAAAAATLAYVAVYAAMNLGAFGAVAAVARRRPRNHLEDYRGLARSSPALAVALAFFLACLAGLPPGLAGLWAKVVVFRVAVDGRAGWLAVVMAVNTVVALYYYARWAASLFAGLAPDGDPAPARVVVPAPVVAALALALLVTVALSVDPDLLLRLHPTPTAAAG